MSELRAAADVGGDSVRIPEGDVLVPAVPPNVFCVRWGGANGWRDARLRALPGALSHRTRGVFASSAAGSLQRTKVTRLLADAARVVAATLRGMFLTRTAHPRPERRDHPACSGILLERARTERELLRL
jgi:hypothetical protein